MGELIEVSEEHAHLGLVSLPTVVEAQGARVSLVLTGAGRHARGPTVARSTTMWTETGSFAVQMGLV